MILLQIVMVSPGTHLVKNHESLSITNESQFTKTRSSKLKMLGPLCNQSVNLETDAKTLYYSLLKLKYSPAIYFKGKKTLGCMKLTYKLTNSQDVRSTSSAINADNI